MIVGVLGGGQLARMLALAGYPLGLEFAFLDPSRQACAFPLGKPFCGGFEEVPWLERFGEYVDLVTYEFENVPSRSVQILSKRVPVDPPLSALMFTQDRLSEKGLFETLDIPTSPFCRVDTPSQVEDAYRRLGLPLVFKTRSQGYDGKGQRVVRNQESLEQVRFLLNKGPLIAERFVDYSREISIIAVRDRQGEMAFYPISENEHQRGILCVARSRIGDPMTALAEDYVKRLLDRLEYVGVLVLELFQVGDQILANEFAPRVHNSGHWTIEGAATNQFENHLRAVVGLPLGSTAPVGAVAMVNCIGAMPEVRGLLCHPDVHLHQYGKSARPGRKIGHVTVRADNEQALGSSLEPIRVQIENSNVLSAEN